jgi:LAO/AO transport system kinase
LKKDYKVEELCERFRNHDKVALARLITLIENHPEKSAEVFSHFKDINNEAYIVGFTGSPGVGKSTLTGKVAQKLLADGKKVGIISVDPTSPFSGGAFLGDRVRMTDISLHPDVFMRSLASRGYKGGISRAVFDITMLYEAYGMDVILIETVGVGQAEFDVYNLAYTIIVMLVPGYGDAIQMQKAGIIEIGDIYDVNKKDLGGEDIAVQIDMMLDDSTFQSGWRPPVIMTDAVNGEGIDELIEKIWDHKEHLELSDLIKEKKRNRYSYKIKELILTRIEDLVSKELFQESDIEDIIEKALQNGKFNIYEKIQQKFDNIKFEIIREE